MGYVNPDPKPELRGFDDQFEWDGSGWLFRRFHRARPVRVTADEMDWSISYFGRWTSRLGTAAVCAGLLFIALWEWLGPDEGPARPVQSAATIGLFAIVLIGRRWIWEKATERFSRRVPVGLGRSWLEHRRDEAAETDWGALFLPLALIAAGAYFLWPFDTISWSDLAGAAFFGSAALFDIILKVRERIL